MYEVIVHFDDQTTYTFNEITEHMSLSLAKRLSQDGVEIYDKKTKELTYIPAFRIRKVVIKLVEYEDHEF